MKILARFLVVGILSAHTLLLTGCGSESSDSGASDHIARSETYADQGQYRSAFLEVKTAIQQEPDEVDHVKRLAALYLEVGAAEPASKLLEPWLADNADSVALPLARAYIMQGKRLSATETLAKATLSTDEEKNEADLIRAVALRLSQQYPEAVDAFKAVQARAPANQEATVGIIRTRLSMKQPDNAIDTADQWLQNNKPSAEILYLKGLAQYQKNNLEGATKSLTDALGELPSSDIFLPVRRETLRLLSRSLTEQGRVTEAQVYNKILADNTDNETREQAEAAIAALKQGKTEEGKKILEDMLKLNPDNEGIALMLGVLNVQQGKLQAGEDLLVSNLDAETTPTPFIRAATMAQLDSGEREQALATLSRATEARPKDVDLLVMHGVLALSIEDQHEAGIKSLSKALDIDPERSRLRLVLAKYYMQHKQQEQALAQMRMAFTHTPADWTVTNHYLTMLFATGNEQEAKELRDSLINGFSDQKEAMLLASVADLKLGNADAALERSKKLAADQPEWAPAHMVLAFAYIRQNNTDQARQHLLQAAKLSPGSMKPLQLAGKVYASDHTPDQVVDWLKKTATETPELKLNALALASQIRIRQGQLDNARALFQMMPGDDHSQNSTVSKALRTQLLVAETDQAAANENWKVAREKAAEAVTLEPDNIRIALLPVSITVMTGKPVDALTELDEVEQTHGVSTATILFRARVLSETKGADKAREYLEEQWTKTQNTALFPALIGLTKKQAPEKLDELTAAWIKSEPGNASAHLNRADYLMQSGDDVQAMSEYRAVLEIQPGHAVALNNLAWLTKDRDRKKALQFASQARDAAPQSAEILDTYGWLLHLDGRRDEALEALEKAQAMAPENADIENHLQTVKNPQ